MHLGPEMKVNLALCADKGISRNLREAVAGISQVHYCALGTRSFDMLFTQLRHIYTNIETRNIYIFEQKR